MESDIRKFSGVSQCFNTSDAGYPISNPASPMPIDRSPKSRPRRCGGTLSVMISQYNELPPFAAARKIAMASVKSAQCAGRGQFSPQSAAVTEYASHGSRLRTIPIR